MIRIWRDTPKPGETDALWCFSRSVDGHVVETKTGFPSEAAAQHAATVKSWKPVVKVVNEEKWHTNALRFATFDEAMASARDLQGRWMAVTACDAHEDTEPVNYRWDPAQGLVAL